MHSWFRNFDDTVAHAKLVKASARRLRELERQYPSLVKRVPPSPTAAAACGDFGEEWLGLVARWKSGDYTLPSVEHKTRLIGPIRCRGYCLEPLICNGASLWFDPRRPAVDGDIVWILEEPAMVQATIEHSQHDSQFMGVYGDLLRSAAPIAHWLRFVDGEFWHLSNGPGGGWPLGESIVLGVLAHVEEETWLQRSRLRR